MAKENRINEMREKYREIYKLDQKERKFHFMQAVRIGVGEILTVIEEKEKLQIRDVAGLCQRIKRLKHATPEDMDRLNQAFLISDDNKTAFIKNVGALAILVKELTGNDSENQIKACETLSSLSVGNAVICEKIVLRAGGYLVTYLKSPDSRLRRTSLWVISNIAATKGKGVSVLKSLEIIPTLVMQLETESDSATMKDLFVALDLVTSTGSIRPGDRDSLRLFLLSRDLGTDNDEYILKIILQTLISEDVSLTEPEIMRIVSFSIYIFQEVKQVSHYCEISKLLLSLRIMSNLITISQFAALKYAEELTSAEILLHEILNKCFDKEIATKEIVWFVKNMLTNTNPNLQVYIKQTKFAENLSL